MASKTYCQMRDLVLESQRLLSLLDDACDILKNLVEEPVFKKEEALIVKKTGQLIVIQRELWQLFLHSRRTR